MSYYLCIYVVFVCVFLRTIIIIIFIFILKHGINSTWSYNSQYNTIIRIQAINLLNVLFLQIRHDIKISYLLFGTNQSN